MDFLRKDYSLDWVVRLETKIHDANIALPRTCHRKEGRRRILTAFAMQCSLLCSPIFHIASCSVTCHLSPGVLPLQLCSVFTAAVILSRRPAPAGKRIPVPPPVVVLLVFLPRPTWLTEGFSARQGQVFVPLCRHGYSPYFQVLSPYPGRDSSIQEDHYPDLPLPLTLPMTGNLRSGSFPLLRDHGRAVLHHVRSVDHRVCTVNERARRIRRLGKEADECEDLEKVVIGDKLVLRGIDYIGKEAEFNPYMPYGMQQVVVDNVFLFTPHNVPARVRTSVLVRCISVLSMNPSSMISNP